MKIPLNRVVAFFGPVINLIAAAVATWLIAKMNILGIPGLGLNGDDLTIAIAGALTALLTAGLLWLGQRKWLQGHHIEMMYAPADVVDAGVTPAPADADDELLERAELALDGGQALPAGLTATDPATIPADIGDGGAQ